MHELIIPAETEIVYYIFAKRKISLINWFRKIFPQREFVKVLDIKRAPYADYWDEKMRSKHIFRDDYGRFFIGTKSPYRYYRARIITWEGKFKTVSLNEQKRLF
jgi:hypothetical protein